MTNRITEELIKAFKEQNLNIDIQNINLFKQELVDTLNTDMFKSKDMSTILDKLRGIQRLSRLGLNEEEIASLYNSDLHSAYQIAHLPEHEFIEEYGQYFSDANRAKEIYTAAVAKKNRVVFDYVALHQHKDKYYNASRFGNLGDVVDNASGTKDANLLGSSTNSFPSYQDLFGGLDYCECSDCRSVLSPAAYLVDLKRIEEGYITNNQLNFRFEDRRPDINNIQLSCENTNTLISKLEIVNEVLVGGVRGVLADSSTASSITSSSKVLSMSNVVEFNEKYYMTYSIFDAFSKRNEMRLVSFNDPNNMDFNTSSVLGSFVVINPNVGIQMSLVNFDDSLYILFNQKYDTTYSALYLGIIAINQTITISYKQVCISPSNTNPELIPLNLNYNNLNLLLDSNQDSLYTATTGSSTKNAWYGNLLFANNNYCISDRKIVPTDVSAKHVSIASLKNAIYFLYIATDNFAYIKVTFFRSTATATKLNINLSTIAPICKLHVYNSSMYIIYVDQDSYVYSATLSIDELGNVTLGVSKRIHQFTVTDIYQSGIPSYLEVLPNSIDKLLLLSANSSTTHYWGTKKNGDIETQEQVFDRLSCVNPGNQTNYPLNLPFNLPVTETRKYLAENNTSLSDIWEQVESAIMDDKKTNLDKLGITEEQWNIVIDHEGTSSTKTAELYGIAYKDDATLISDLSNVDTFLKQTGISYKSLNNLLYQDLSVNEINAVDYHLGKFFINSGGKPLVIHEKKLMLRTTTNGTLSFDNCTVGHFDRLNRFIRLASLLQWSFAELDWALYNIANALSNGNNEVTASVINAGILPHLTWIKTLVDSKKLTINEVCGFLYKIRTYGVLGHTMFDQIFYPFYKNKSDVIDKYLKINDTSDPENNKIKNMLSSSLKVSSNDFDEMVTALANSQTDKTKLQLTTINLARLYRLSLLPRLTGLSIDECKILFTLDSGTNGEVNLQSDLLYSLGNAKDPLSIVKSLISTVKKLKQNNFSVYQLQYWLTNYSDDNSIRNKIFDDKTLTNFVSSLYKAEEPLFFTKDVFNKAILSIENEFNNIIDQNQGISLSDRVFNQITNVKKYVVNGIITSIPSVGSTENLIVLCTVNTDFDPENFDPVLINTAATLIHQALVSTSELQQQTYYHQLSTIHGLEDRFSQIFEKESWADLTLLECIQEFGKITESTSILHDDSTTQQKSVVYKLRLIQKFADLIGNVGLSYTETDILDKNPKYFDISVENSKFKLTFATIENIKKFKSLQKEFQDHGNKLIDFCSSSSDGIAILSDLMDEDESEIKKISEHFFGPVTNSNSHKNINAVWNIKKCFDICNKLYISADDIIEITKIAGKTGVSTGYFTNTDIASEKSICFSNIVKLGDKNYIAWSNSKNEIRCAVIDLDNEEKLTKIYQLAIDDNGTKANGINPSVAVYQDNLYISYVTNVSELSNIIVGKVNIQVNVQNDILGYKVIPHTLTQESIENTSVNISCIDNSNPSLVSHEDNGLYISYIKGTRDYSAYNDIVVAKIELNTNKDVNPVCSFIRVFDTYSTLHKNRFIGSAINLSKKIFVSYNDENNDTYIVFFDLLNEKWNENAILGFESDTAPKLVADKKSDEDGILSLLYLDAKGFNLNSESISYKSLVNNTDANLYGTSKITYRFKSRSNPIPYLDQTSFVFLPENISNHNLFYLKDSTVTNNTDTLAKQKNLADRIWSGLSKKYADNPDKLKKIKNSLLNDKRNALLPLTVHNLRSKGIEINNGRDLYEYFLIDVEVDSVVETSRIVEANSALQLYIHRCRNNLEKYAEVAEQLDEWWPWMQNYRVWQANREVFLYPENYIEPSLRKNKTQLFKQLENDLQQSDLNSFNVEKVLDSYVDNLAIIADLDVIGAAAYDQINEENVDLSTKNLMFIGATKQEPTKYYYLTAVFNINIEAKEYVPTFWSEWKEISCHLQPVKVNTNGIVTPVFAFDKWHIFWVEEQQTGQDSSTHNSKYTANIYYSYLNNADNWSAKNLCGISDLGTTQIKNRGIYYDRVNLEYLASVNTIYVGYAGNSSQFKVSRSNLGLENDHCVQRAKQVKSNFILSSGRSNIDIEVSMDVNTPVYLYSNIVGTSRLYYIAWSSYQTGNSPIYIGIIDVGDSYAKIYSTRYIGVYGVAPALSFKGNNLVITYTVVVDNNANHVYKCTTDLNLTNFAHEAVAYYKCKGYYNLMNNDVSGYDNAVYIDPNTMYLVGPRNYTPSQEKVTSTWIAGNSYIEGDTEHKHNYCSFLYRCNDNYYHLSSWRIGNSETRYYIDGVRTIKLTQEMNPSYIDDINFNGESEVMWTRMDKVYAGKIDIYSDELKFSKIKSYNFPSKSLYGKPFVFNNKIFCGLNTGKLQFMDMRKVRDSFSLTFWFCINKLPINGSTITLLRQDSDNILIRIDSSGRLINAKNTSLKDINNTEILIKPNKFYHLCIPRNYDDAIFVNAKRCTGNSFIYYSISVTEEILIDIQNFPGSIQEVVLFDKRISENELTELYNNSKNKLSLNVSRLKTVTDTQNTSITSQPNWVIVKKDNAQYLQIISTDSETNPKLSFIRLNSTAVTKLDSSLYLEGVDDLLTINNQKSDEIPFTIATSTADKKPSDKLDFTSGPMANYYWEIFFHVPFLVARQLQNARQFDQAKEWFEHIFNPSVTKVNWQIDTTKEDSQNDKYWRFLGLRSEYNLTLLAELKQKWADEIKSDTENASQLYEYHSNPFDPHSIARLRPIAYQKAIVMHYINNLISWGDSLYNAYTTETINDAMLAYVTAYDLLGKKPADFGECALPSILNLKTIVDKYKDHVRHKRENEFIILLENAINSTMLGISNPINYIPNSYFGLPSNEQFEQYWDTVEQRIYNIRHSLNIDGMYEKVDLFAPAINPMELVSQVSSNNSLDQNFGNLNTNVPYYRFNSLVPRAKEITNIVIQFGQSLLSALEKKDAEALSRLYNANQLNLSNLGILSKQNELSGASSAIEGLQASLKNAQDRLNHYTNLIDGGLSSNETNQINLEISAIALQTAAIIPKSAATAMYLFPNVFGFADGGMRVADSTNQTGVIIDSNAQITSTSSGLCGLNASFERRKEDWELQQTLAQDDINQITAQIKSAKYQLSTAQNELKTLQKNIEQEQNVSAFFFSKFTNQELYQWLIGKLSALYFQSYNLALKLARQAEQAWQFEKSVEQKLIQGNYWNGSYRGLLAGESLLLDIHRMEQAYMDQDKRLLEIQKTISLAQLDPTALHSLRTTGSCTFNILEKDLAADYPGHYRRQIKAISLTLPTLIGPYQNIHATLTQTSSKVLIEQNKGGVEYLLDATKPVSSSVRSNVMSNQQIAISQGVNDSGLISLNFNDERYLPFEGTGAVSSWTLDIPHGTNSIDFDNLTDVIVQMNYTAVAGDNSFKNVVKNALVLNSSKAYSMKDDFTPKWNSFIASPSIPLKFGISATDLRKGLKEYKVTDFTIMLHLTESGKTTASDFNEEEKLCTIQHGSDSSKECKFTYDSSILVASVKLNPKADVNSTADFTITNIANSPFIKSSNVSNMVVIAHYEAKIS